MFLSRIINSPHFRTIKSFYRTHACRTSVKQFTVLFRGPKLWNSLPKDIVNQEI